MDLDEYQANVNQTRIFSRQFAEICVDVTVYNGEVVRVQHFLNLLRKNVAQHNTASVGYLLPSPIIITPIGDIVLDLSDAIILLMTGCMKKACGCRDDLFLLCLV